MKEFMVLVKGKEVLDYSPEELQKRLEEFRVWADALGQQYEEGRRLERKGTHIESVNKIHTDGPFLEAKEIIAGYFILHASDLKEATAIAVKSPLLQYFELFVRPLVQSS